MRAGWCSIVLYVAAIVAILMTIGAANRGGSEFGFGGHSLEFSRWTVFFALVPGLLLVIFAVLAWLDSTDAPAVRSPAPGIVAGCVDFAIFSLIGFLALNLAFDGQWVTRQPEQLPSRTRAASWLGYSYFAAGLAYFAHAAFCRARAFGGHRRRISGIRYWLFGALPTLAISTFALVLYLTDRAPGK